MSSVPSKAVLVDIYRRMALIQRSDDRFRAVIKAGKIVAPYYSPRGQEAIPAAVSVNLTNEDTICTIYRGIHDMLAKGVPSKLLWAEIAGKATGTCKGKGGPMHITHPDSGVMVTTGIVGSSMPIANGLAWGSKLKGNDAVTVAYFGDGAANIGAFHESLNLASLWKLPVIFVCSNNGYGEHTKTGVAMASDTIAEKAATYAMPGFRIDGNDPLAIYATAKTAVERARAGEGPTLIEAMTFRFEGHVFGDADAYMDPGEKDARRKDDPWPRYRAYLLDGRATEAELDAIDEKHKQAIDAAMQFALDSPFPDVAEVRRDVYEYEVVE